MERVGSDVESSVGTETAKLQLFPSLRAGTGQYVALDSARMLDLIARFQIAARLQSLFCIRSTVFVQDGQSPSVWPRLSV